MPNKSQEGMRDRFHSFWNNKLYGDGDYEPVFPTYAEIVSFFESELATAVESERTKHIEELTKIWNVTGGSELLRYIAELRALSN